MDVYWGAPNASQGATINYTVEYHTPFWNNSVQIYTTDTNANFPGLKPGTRYDINVRVVAGNLSDPATYHAYTGKDTTFSLFIKQTFGFVIYIYCIS